MLFEFLSVCCCACGVCIYLCRIYLCACLCVRFMCVSVLMCIRLCVRVFVCVSCLSKPLNSRITDYFSINLFRRTNEGMVCCSYIGIWEASCYESGRV